MRSVPNWEPQTRTFGELPASVALIGGVVACLVLVALFAS